MEATHSVCASSTTFCSILLSISIFSSSLVFEPARYGAEWAVWTIWRRISIFPRRLYDRGVWIALSQILTAFLRIRHDTVSTCRIADIFWAVQHVLCIGFISSIVAWYLNILGIHGFLTSCRLVWLLRELLNRCGVSGVKKVITCLRSPHWADYLIVHIDSCTLYNAWKFWYFSDLHVLR